jgi:lysophospholipase L1-like esterase
LRRVASAVVAAALSLCAAAPAQARWVGAWETAMQGAYPINAKGSPFDEPYPALMDLRAHDQTFRMIVRPVIDGRAARVVFSNSFGDQPLVLGHSTVATALPGGGASAPQDLSFSGGAPGVTIAPGGEAVSDPVTRAVRAGEDLAVSFHVRGDSGKLTWHGQAYSTSFLAAAHTGDRAAATAASEFGHHTGGFLVVRRLDVDADAPAGVIVALGDSLVDGEGSTVDGHDRWSDLVVRRLAARAPAGRYALLNAGIDGNGLLLNPCRPCAGPPALARLDQDVLGAPGVSDAIVLVGTNDVFAGRSAAEIVAGLRQIVARLRAAGVRAIGSPLLPREQPPVLDYETVRQKVNAYIRAPGSFDAIVDFDAAVRDPAQPARIRPGHTSDGVHPNPAGQALMAGAVDLAAVAPEPALAIGARATGAGRTIRVALTCAGRPQARCRARVRLRAAGGQVTRRVDAARGAASVAGSSRRFATAVRVRATVLPSGPTRLLTVSRRRSSHRRAG